MMQLSKSDYILYLKHPAWLWLKKHDKEKLPHIDDNTQAVFDAGNLFEGYAEKHFDNGVRLGFTDYSSYLALPEQTLEALLGGVKTIFQARFLSGQITCICDVIDVVGDKTFDLYEIKSSTSAKPEHIIDLAFQVKVIEDAGFKVRNVFVIHVNNEYVRNGDIDPQRFSVITDVTDKVRKKAEYTLEKIDAALATMQLSEIPDISPSLAGQGAFSEWLGIYKSLSDLPEDTIYDLCGLNATKVGDLESTGITTIQEIPDDYKLSPKQALQVQAAKLDQQLVQSEPIRDFLSHLQFPLYFLDYETLAGIVPAFDGLRPYQQLPFQYSLHILDSPDANLRQVEYLHREATNPSEPLSKALRSHIGDEGSVIVWNESFEKKCNSLLAEIVPEQSEFLNQVNDRIVDLMVPFAKGWFVDKRFCGSASIKNVLPVIAPQLSYKALGIQEGASAQRLWVQSVIDGKDHIDQEVLFADLIEYCKLDTLAMVEAFNVLRKI
ncbi:MAG: hypothetical protein QG628_61 [Patescibacteria group bacterium]|nr:hypothetical protein [Patescibacteria group bacterium]